MLSESQLEKIGKLQDPTVVLHHDILAFARAVEAEVRKEDTELIRQLVEALEYHRAQTRPIHRTDEAITAGRARLGGKP